MAVEIRIPRLGWNMDEGVFVGWLKADGDPVRSGEALFSLEGEKATQDVEATEDGTLKIPATAPGVGDRVAVGVVIGYLLQPGEAARSKRRPRRSGRDDRGPGADTSDIDLVPSPSVPARNGPRASPLARRIARDLKIDWTTLRGSGSSGRIRKADVLAASRVKPEAANTSRHRSIPVSPTRRTIAARMIESRATTAAVTLTSTIDATNLVNLRGQFRAGGQDVPSYTDFAVKLTALALKDHPLLNSRWLGDRIELSDSADVGIAVDTEVGLLVPVIRDAGGLGLRQIASRSRDLIQRARDGSLSADEMRGGTFTVTNLGSFGIEAFTPIVNTPECAILGLGRIERRPVMAGDQVVGRDLLSLSLTFDHRIVDGAPAARFLQSVGRLIENPGPWLMS